MLFLYVIKRRILSFLSKIYAQYIIGAGIDSFVSRRAELVGSKIIIGKRCKVLKNAKLDTSSNPSNADFRKNTSRGYICLGDGVVVKDYALLYSYDGFIRIGDNVTINPFTIIYGHGGVTIGSNVLIAANSIIISSNHNFDSNQLLISKQGLTSKGVNIGNNVWIGSNVKILDGVSIEDGCVIAAGSVVNKNLKAFGVYAGVPARLIKKRID